MITYTRDGKKYIIDEATGNTQIIDLAQVALEIEELGIQIVDLESVLNDDEQLLAWAKQEYPIQSGLENIKALKLEKEGLL